MAIDWNYVIELARKWLFVIVVLAIIAIYVIVQKISESIKRRKKIEEMKRIMTPLPPKEKPTEQKQEQPQQPQPIEKVEIKEEQTPVYMYPQTQVEMPIDNDSFAQLFNDKETKLSGASLKDVLKQLGTESDNVEQQMTKDFDMLKNKLQDIHNKKEAVRQYGMKLAKLFDNYRHREFQLTEMMVGLEKILAKSKTVRQIETKEEPRS